MKKGFFTSFEGFTHHARFYGIPCYIDIETATVAGTNVVFDWLITVATIFHNYAVEPATQALAAITGADYEPGFPIYVFHNEGGLGEADEYDEETGEVKVK